MPFKNESSLETKLIQIFVYQWWKAINLQMLFDSGSLGIICKAKMHYYLFYISLRENQILHIWHIGPFLIKLFVDQTWHLFYRYFILQFAQSVPYNVLLNVYIRFVNSSHIFLSEMFLQYWSFYGYAARIFGLEWVYIYLRYNSTLGKYVKCNLQ